MTLSVRVALIVKSMQFAEKHHDISVKYLKNLLWVSFIYLCGAVGTGIVERYSRNHR